MRKIRSVYKRKIAWKKYIMVLFMVSYVQTSFGICKTFQYRNDNRQMKSLINGPFSCLIGLVAGLAMKLSLREYLDGATKCANNELNIKSHAKMSSKEIVDVKQCQVVSIQTPLKADLVVRQESPCKHMFNLLLSRLNGKKINLIVIKNYSNFCFDKKAIEIKGYCCPEQKH